MQETLSLTVIHCLYRRICASDAVSYSATRFTQT